MNPNKLPKSEQNNFHWNGKGSKLSVPNVGQVDLMLSQPRPGCRDRTTTMRALASNADPKKSVRFQNARIQCQSIGRRKNAVCRVRAYHGKGDIYINHQSAYDYFQNQTSVLQIVLKPMLTLSFPRHLTLDICVYGGGLVSQAYAIQLGLSRAYSLQKPVYERLLRQAGLLTRDPREKERKKYGLKKARKAPQFSKR